MIFADVVDDKDGFTASSMRISCVHGRQVSAPAAMPGQHALFERKQSQRERKTDRTDRQNAGIDVGGLEQALIAQNVEAEAVIGGDQFGDHHHHEPDAERDADAGKRSRQRRRQHDANEPLRHG